MRRKSVLPELLAPAGSFEALCAAVTAGADAVYVGGKSFGARAYAKNFDIEELRQAVEYCHLHGVKLYVTLNTLLEGEEVTRALDFAEELYVIGVDALIVCDLGLISQIRKRGIDIELHGSTQMSVHNSYGADAVARMGISRVVLARELSGRNIKATTEACRPQTEVFLHGALCVCHSGQCLFSSLVGGRSGNRGECAQPCRLPYGRGYPLSLSDLSLAGHIPELIESGTASLKIEGRMKSPHYVYTVTSVYRRLLDENRCATEEEMRLLYSAFARGGFTDGYFTGKFEKMTGIRSEADKEITRSSEDFLPEIQRVKVRAKCEILREREVKLTLSTLDGKRSVTVTAPPPEEARSSPLQPASVKERLSKMGASFLSLSPSDIELSLDDGLNMSPGAINALRREACEKLQYCGRDRGEWSRKTAPKPTPRVAEIKRSALFFNTESYLSVKDCEELSFFDLIFLPLEEVLSMKAPREGVYLPPVIVESEIPVVEEKLGRLASLGVRYALVGNIGAIAMAKRAGLIPVGDFRLNVTNPESYNYLLELGLSEIVLSPELTPPHYRDIGGGAIVYGRIPLMLTERCFVKENFGCKSCGTASLVDRLGKKFPIIRESGHRNLILNSTLTYMGDKRDILRGSSVRFEHFLFTTESGEEILRAIRSYRSGAPLRGVDFRRMGRRKDTGK